MKLSWHARGAATAERMRRLMQLRGVTPNGHPLWRPPETGRVENLHPHYHMIFAEPWARSRPATYSKAGRMGLTKARGRPWTDNEILRLRKVYPRGTREEIIAAFPDRTWAAIAKAANSRGIYRAPRPLKPTGNRVLDQILERARERNVSMIELDQEAKRKGYFSKRKWKHGRLDHTAHFRAVAFLGGNLRSKWTGTPNPNLRRRPPKRRGYENKAVAA
ncbi:hypothetical protein [Devosia geojensis]|uniref:hypothetical protein n=1 Tax=Devosia geojensis TaxID=443610 RepID=UPI000ABA1837|nr:hypothetical protein [Devosia geojensis]